MADDDKPKGFDISQLGRNTEQFERHAKVIEKYDKLLGNMSPLAGAYEALQRQTAPLAKVHEALERQNAPLRKVAEALTKHSEHIDSNTQELAKRIQAQQEGLARVSEMRERDATPPLRPDLMTVRNPVVDRLERIEKQFDELAGVAAEGLGAGLALQGAALALQEKADQFLNEFREAARDTSRSGKVAIGVSVVAILITTLVPLASSYFFPDRGAAAMEKSIADMQGQIVRMREEQAATAQKLVDALAAGDQATADVVGRALEQALSKGASEPSDAPNPP